MQILTTSGWEDYELIDTGDGSRLERFGKYILSRPDPQIIWKKKLTNIIWNKADAVFKRTTEDKGHWIKNNPLLPDKWKINYKNISFFIKLSPFKHTGIFPEQHLQWDLVTESIKSRLALNNEQPNILNLFAYTGIASLIMANAGAKVTHVDASFPTIKWAKENQEVSQLTDKPIRWIEDDCKKFVLREIKRGIKYDGVIMDPPAFGHSPNGTIWKFNYHFPELLELCKQVISENPLFIIVNAYAISSSAITLGNVLNDFFGNINGNIEIGELTLQEKENKRLLSTGIFARWVAK